MKKTITCILSVLLLCTALCGCGSDRMGNEDVVIQSPGISPMISPEISPDMDNGLVEEQDGMLEDDHRSPETGLQTDAPASAAPAPTATEKP